ncbi:hypothetical protein IFM89_021936 [Coptis chinensis]|uniref:Uncharacterized protein n=1 Tax=Coptis chinensis TaxID=261450 RepID=A0A835LSF8_9MAGN|nr:hypothetical protein IFM89_021936 [Coptis chinensis]
MDEIGNFKTLAKPFKQLSTSASLKLKKKNNSLVGRAGSDIDDFINLLHGSDPVKVELNRLENEVKEKDRELGDAHAEIKGLKYSERLKDKAVEELTEELKKVDGKLKATEVLLENKYLEIKKINDEKKEALAAQFAAEATLRRVHAAQRDDEMPPIEAIIAPLEAELRMARLEDEMKTLDRELARAKVNANRVAVVVANEWKDANEKVMPVKQWLEERRFLQGEMQHLRDKLAVAERTAKAEAQLKEKYHLRIRVLEEGLKTSFSVNGRSTLERSMSNVPSQRQSLGGADITSRSSSNSFSSKRAPLASNSATALLRHAKGSSRSFDGGTRSLDRNRVISNVDAKNRLSSKRNDGIAITGITVSSEQSLDGKSSETKKMDHEDYVSGHLYDMLQKEVITLRKVCHERDQTLKDKDDAIEMLAKKVDTLTKAMEVEAKKMRREVTAMEKEVASMRVNKEQDMRARRLATSKVPGRTMRNGLLGRIVTGYFRTFCTLAKLTTAKDWMRCGLLAFTHLATKPISSFLLKRFAKEVNFDHEITLYGDAQIVNAGTTVNVTQPELGSVGEDDIGDEIVKRSRRLFR